MVHVIATRDEYLAAVEKIAAGHGPIAIDAERASGFRYSQRAYLIQIFRRGAGTFLFDPPPIGDFSELNAAIEDEEWILHAASQDLTCLREIGLNPKRIYDTELGARLAGLPRVGLGTVVEDLLGIHLAKEHSAADWSTRPLPQAWLVYAALDVELLVDLREKMGELLEADGKTFIADQEFDSVAKRDFTIVRVEPWRRLSGLASIRGQRGLAVARELWEARDAYAREIDTAPGRLVPDAALTAAAKALPATKRDLSAIKEFTGRASRSQLDRWWAAIERGMATTDLPATRAPGESIPAPRIWSDRNPEADKRLKAARASLTELSEFFHIPLENLLTPDTLRRVAWAPPAEITVESISAALAELGARPWQVDATAQKIVVAFVEASQTIEQGDEPAS
ncbi:HRDC domain-containing protein [Conyzicola nivalis]|uniref:HRDC domain-containing protein n=1 Tax=Conyzicola nivalis TaxID=1477021 RepID=UPI001E5BD6C8|nr:HRDC domain-containing protein [Conyzicola nivalis]